MYKGKRDAHMTIEVPMELCYEVKHNGTTWIEVFIPDKKENLPGVWSSFIVKPEQVCFLDDKTNIIENINRGTGIKCAKHFADKDGKRKIVPGTEEFLDPMEIKQRIDFYVYLQNYRP